MAGSQLKRVEKSIQAMRDNPSANPASTTADALEDLTNALRSVERQLEAIEGRKRTKAMDLPNRD